MRRPRVPVGPWERVGILSDDALNVLSLWARRRDRRSFGRFDYRAVVDDVPVELFINEPWRADGSELTHPALGGATWTVHLYENYT